MRIRENVFRRIGRGLSRVRAYARQLLGSRTSQTQQTPRQDARNTFVDSYFGYRLPASDSVPLISEPISFTQDVRLIAFYLPQFHPIPENDVWWGKGFTEWTNVSRAVPQFENHYQPRLPGELGFYDLRLPEVQRRQAELAKLYGISAFCIYFYWFDGKILLEKPLQNLLENPHIDQKFFICWANENWSRRWDGRDDDVLIEQVYSPQSNLDFISHISKYMRDPRYLRIDGRPILAVYRPQLLPAMRDTARAWREWCRQNGIGEIYLLVTHSFGAIDPRDYGCDAAVEFPPNGSNATDVTQKQRFLNPEFDGRAYDWSFLVKRSRAYAKPRYPLFRCVCPSWDNEARRPGKGSIFVNSTPPAYCEWLENAILETRARAKSPDERLVFINAWNEWAEGAYLEPDRRFGYAYLEATRVALARAHAKSKAAALDPGSAKIAIVIHAYYMDAFREIIEILGHLDRRHKVIVTTTAEHEHEVAAILASTEFDYDWHVFENRGRDVLPFLSVLKKIDIADYAFVLKLHTKKSLHRKDGDLWRQQACSCLATPAQRDWIMTQLCRTPQVGMVGAHGHIISVRSYIGRNSLKISELARRLGVDINLDNDHFVAGTMFFARSEALRPLLNISLQRSDFEPECGQLDGTMAHAVERAFAYSAAAGGFVISSANIGDADQRTSLQSFVDHQFAFAAKM